MPSGQRVVVIRLAYVLACLLSSSGCALLPDADESRGVKLSDAMKSSAQGDHRDLGGSSSHDHYNNPESDDSKSSTTPATVAAVGDFTAVSYDKSDYSWQVPADVSYSLPINSAFQSIIHFTLTPVCIEDERNFFGFYLGGAIVELQPGSLPERAVDQTWMFETGLTYRRYLNSSWNALSPYVAVSAGYVLLNWTYRNPVLARGETVGSDSLNGVEGSIAIGVSTRRDSRFSFFGEAGIGGTMFSWETNQGYDNDVFHNFGFLSVKAGVSFKF